MCSANTLPQTLCNFCQFSHEYGIFLHAMAGHDQNVFFIRRWEYCFSSLLLFVINNIQLFPEGEVNSGGYIPRCEASRYIYPPLFTDPEGDSCFSIYQIRWIKKHFFNFFFWNFRKTFFSPFAKQWMAKDIPSYGSQSKRVKIAIHWFGKY